MRSILKARTLLLLVVIAMLAVACAADEADETEEAVDTTTEAAGDVADEVTEEVDEVTETEAMDAETEAMDGATEGDAAMTDSAEACDADAIVEMVESGPDAGTLGGMAEDPVATAASNNPVLTTLASAVEAAGLVDTLNSAEALTVFAPTDCAFAELDQATMDAAMADPEGLLTTVLGYHVIDGEEIPSDELSGEYTTFIGEPITVEGTSVADGQAQIVVPDIDTANATVHLIDAVLMPPSAGQGGEAGADATEADATEADATEAGTEEDG